MAKIFSQAQMDEIYAYFKDKMNSLECIRVPELKPFDECTWDEVLAFVDGYYNGLYSLAYITDVWNIGDSKSITTSAIVATTVNGSSMNAVAQQTMDWVIIDFNHDDLSTPINGRRKALLTLASKSALSTGQKMADSGKHTVYYDQMPLRLWLNDNYYNAIPSNIKAKIKTVSRLYNKVSTNAEIDELVFLQRQKEVMGNSGTYGTQYPYYENASNRIKHNPSTNYPWWWIAEYIGGSSTTEVRYLLYSEEGLLPNYLSTYQYNVAPSFCL